MQEGNVVTDKGVMLKLFPGLLSGLALLVPGQSFAAGSLVDNPDLVDNRFETYYLQPCLDGAGALIARGWSFAEVIEYNNGICSVVFNSGTFNSTDSYASTSNLGSIAAQSKTADTLAQQQIESVQDRLDELKEEDNPVKGGWGILLSAQTGESERKSTDDEIGYDSELDGFVIGLDYRFNDRLVVGAALGSTRDEADFDGSSGELKTESESIMVYSTYVLGRNGYIDGYLGTAPLDYTTERDISIDGEAADAFGFSGRVAADFEGDQTLAGISAGYDWYPSQFSYGVFGAIDYSKTEVDGYDEKGTTGLELEYPDQDSKSLTVTLGVNGSYTIDVGWGSLVPNISVATVHQSENDSRSFDARLLIMPDVDTTSLTLETDSPDRDYIITSLGVVLALNSGGQFFVTYEELASHDFLDTWALSAGFLTEF